MLHQQQDCEDAIQTTFRKALRTPPNYREENLFKSCLFRIGRNEAVDIICHRRQTIIVEAPEEYLGGLQDIVSLRGARELIEEKGERAGSYESYCFAAGERKRSGCDANIGRASV